MGNHSVVLRKSGRRWRRGIVAAAALGLAAASIAGLAGAAPSTSTSDVAFVALTNPHKVFGGSVTAHGTKSVAVLGGATTVPTNATSVRLDISVTGPAAGSLDIYPADNPTGGSGQMVSWAASGTGAATVHENVGIKDELTLANSSASAAKVTATVTGYSTQVTAGDVNGTGGSAGQVLTNDGSGGASWQSQGQVYASHTTSYQIVGVTEASVDAVTVPAGLYLVTDNFVGRSATTGDQEFCHLTAPNAATGPVYEAMDLEPAFGAFFGNGFVQTVISVSVGGAISLRCNGTTAVSSVGFNTMVATQVSAAHGVVLSG
jgi:hypothetical protein